METSLKKLAILPFVMLCAAICLSSGAVALCSCSGNGNVATKISDTSADTLRTVPVCADSLYSHVERQVTLGPRTPGSEAHERCVALITGYLKACGVDTVVIQSAPVTTFKGEKFTAKNILGRINPEAADRVLLLAHYDTRPWADSDPDESMHDTPIDGANDGASGVAVLMETARVLAPELPDSLGVDLLFVDMEDSGESGGSGDTEETWCRGTQEGVKQMPYTTENRPRFGILLDMVGGRDALFHREYFSQRHASPVVDKVWSIARRSGFGERFVNQPGGAVVDDHLFVNRAGIPCIDIIESINGQTGSFNPTWHTMGDNLSGIDRNTLKAAAQTVVNTILN